MKPEFTVCVYLADESEASFSMANPSFSNSRGKPDKRSSTKEVRQKKFQTVHRKSTRSLVGRPKNTEVEVSESDQSDQSDQSDEDESDEDESEEENAPEGNDTAGVSKLKKKGEKKSKKKSEKKEDPVHYDLNGIDIREDVNKMTKIPLDFYYKKVLVDKMSTDQKC